MAGRKYRHGQVTPPPEPPEGFDPDDHSWHGYRRNWKSDLVWVDLRPVQDRVMAETARRLKMAKASAEEGWDPHDFTVLEPRERTQAVGVAGECAVAMFLGAHYLKTGTKGDVRTRVGQEFYEVKTAYKWYPFKKYPPAANCNRNHPPKADIILCVAEGIPTCFNRIGIVGWLPRENFSDVGRKASWGGMSYQWDADHWRSIYEIAADELVDPALAVGMPGRRTIDDEGIEPYIAHWVYGGHLPPREEVISPKELN